MLIKRMGVGKEEEGIGIEEGERMIFCGKSGECMWEM